MNPDTIKANIERGQLTAKRHFWETAKREGFEDFVREIAKVFGIDAGEIEKGNQLIARWQR